MLQPVFNKINRNESGEISAKLHVNNVKTNCIKGGLYFVNIRLNISIKMCNTK
jgi:hypothetical protein